MISRRQVLGLGAALLSACTIPLQDRAEYPPSLPAPSRASQDCPDFSAWVRNAGVEVHRDGSHAPSLLARDVLNLGALFDQDDELHLTLETRVVPALGIPGTGHLNEARLRVESRSGRSWEAPASGQGLCRSGTLIIPLNPAQSGVGGAPGVVASHGDSAHLMAGQDGSVIAMRQTVDAGIALVMPWYSRKFSYHQFERAGSTR